MKISEAIYYLDVFSSTNGSGLCTDEQHFIAKRTAMKSLSEWRELQKEVLTIKNIENRKLLLTLIGKHIERIEKVESKMSMC